MTVAVQCPHCEASYQVADKSLGRTAKCKTCGKRFPMESFAGSKGKSDLDTSAGQAARETKGSGKRAAESGLPERLGRFEIKAKLGAGAFGIVYHAYDSVLDREVALKVPHTGLLADEENKQRYLREPKAAGRLRHPNIVPVFEAGFDSDSLYIASAFIEGQTLEDSIRGAPIEFRKAATLVMKLAEAMDYAHRQKVIHRDIKPANIMIDSDGEPLIMDFGLARIQEAADRLSQDGTVLGTPAYMPPEQARGQLKEVGPASDQYSLGVVLYELLTRERPFSGPPELVISLVINEEPERPSSHNADVPGDLETVCLKAMAKESDKRYDDCHGLAEDLERWLDDRPIEARRSTRIERFVRWSRRNPVLAGLTGIVAALLVCVAVVSTFAAVQLSAEQSRTEAKATEAIEQQKLAETSAAEARQQTKLAAERLIEVEAQREEANKQREEAQTQTVEAQRQAGLAIAANKLADERLQTANRSVYNLQLGLAHNSLAYNSDEALQQLEDVSKCPKPMRDFTWNLIHSAITATDRKIISSPGPNTAIIKFHVSRDGQRIAISWGSANGRNEVIRKGVVVYDGTGKEIYSPQSVGLFHLSPDGKYLAVSTGGGLAVIDIAKKQAVQTFQPRVFVGDAWFSPSGRLLVVRGGRGNKTLFLLDASDLKQKSAMTTLQPVSNVSFSPNEEWLAYQQNVGKTVVLRRLQEPVERIEVESVGHAPLSFSADSRYLTVPQRDGLLFYDFEERKLVQLREVPATEFGSIEFLSNGKQFVTRGARTKLWDYGERTPSRLIQFSVTRAVSTFLDNGQIIYYSPAGDVFVRPNVKQIESVEIQTSIGKVGQVDSLHFSPDGKLLAARNSNSEVVVVSTEDSQTLVNVGIKDLFAVSDEERCSIRTIEISPNGQQLIALGSVEAKDPKKRGTGKFDPWGSRLTTAYDVTSRQKLWSLSRKPQLGYSRTTKRYSPDGRWFALRESDGVHIYDTVSGEDIDTLHPKNSEPFSVMSFLFSPDGLSIAVVSRSPDRNTAGGLVGSAGSTRVQVFHTENWTETHETEAVGKYCAFSANSQRLAFQTADKHLSILSTDDWAVVKKYPLAQTISDAHPYFEPSGDHVAIVISDRFQKFSLSDGSQETVAGRGYRLTSSMRSLSPDLLTLAEIKAPDRLTISLQDPITQHERILLRGPGFEFDSLLFSNDGKQLAGIDDGGRIQIWRIP